MEFEKSITMEELVKMHEEIMAKFTQGNEPIDNAKELSEAALKTSEDTVKEIVDLISVLSKERQVEIAIKMRKMVAATYLTAVSEAIDLKQSCKANINARQTSYSTNGAKDSRVEDIMVVHNSK